MHADTKELSRLKELIADTAFVRATDQNIVSRRKKGSAWLFDIRAILTRQDVLEILSSTFWSQFHSLGKIQIGCIETAGIPLMAGLVALAKQHAVQDCTGFFIRKSRKKDGLLKMIEGTFDAKTPVVLVDDLTNSGNSLIRQVEVVEAAGGRVKAAWTILRFRDSDYYAYFREKNIPLYSLFELNDFTDTLGIQNLALKKSEVARQAFDVLWSFRAENPSYEHVVPKSDPILDDERVYFGCDNGVFFALNQADGSVAWSFPVGLHPKGKGIFSSPAIEGDTVFFGAYDGNVYALDKTTGKRKWIFFDADWVGSSPAVASDLGTVFIGLEFGLWRKRGGIVAIDIETGVKKWEYAMPCYTHSSPLYIKETREVVVGSNDGAAYLFNAHTGALVWKFETGTLTEEELRAGFSTYDIKESFAYDPVRDLVIFGNRAGVLYSLERASGTLRSSFRAEFGFYSTPVIFGNTALASSLDKHLYSLDLDTFQLRWKWNAGARIFSTPVVVHDSIYVGANTGRLTELSAEGKTLSQFTVTERITNRVAFNPRTERFFLPTFANELYCLKKKVTGS